MRHQKETSSRKRREPMVLRGRVIRGDGFGRRLGYPTANLSGRTTLGYGVYVGWATVNKKRYAAVAVIGVNGKREVHLLHWHGNLYRKSLSMVIVKRLRPIRRYPTQALLKKQIVKDIAGAQMVLQQGLRT